MGVDFLDVEENAGERSGEVEGGVICIVGREDKSVCEGGGGEVWSDKGLVVDVGGFFLVAAVCWAVHLGWLDMVGCGVTARVITVEVLMGDRLMQCRRAFEQINGWPLSCQSLLPGSQPVET